MFAAAVIKSTAAATPLENHVWSLIGRHFRMPTAISRWMLKPF
jgi:hypothetical protein